MLRHVPADRVIIAIPLCTDVTHNSILDTGRASRDSAFIIYRQQKNHQLVDCFSIRARSFVNWDKPCFRNSDPAPWQIYIAGRAPY